MKLKLEQTEDVTILVINEGIEAAQIPILKAGLKKLFQANRSLVVLDLLALSNVSLESQAMIKELEALPAWAQEQSAQLAIVSKAVGVGTASTREEGIRAIKSPLAALQILEARLQTQIRALEAQKVDLTQKMNGIASADSRTLRRDNSELKRAVGQLEEFVQKVLKNRTEPYVAANLKNKWDTMNNVLLNALVQDGALPPKGTER